MTGAGIGLRTVTTASSSGGRSLKKGSCGFTAPPSLDTWNAACVEGVRAEGSVVDTACAGPIWRAIVWKHQAGGYDSIDLGAMPGTTIPRAIGIDDGNRALGYSTSLLEPIGVPLVWTDADGLADLITRGFPCPTRMRHRAIH